MGFRCAITKKHCQNAPLRVIVEKREVIYPQRFGYKVDKESGKREQVCIDQGGKGWEIVKEIMVDPRLAHKVPDCKWVKH